MTKRQVIDEIVLLNRSADPGFLAQFEDDDLSEYLQRLLIVGPLRPEGDVHLYDQSLQNCQATDADAVARPSEEADDAEVAPAEPTEAVAAAV